MVTAYQSSLADDPQAPDDFARGNLDGDISIPKEPVDDPVVVNWAERTEPRLSPRHDTVARALASFFPREGGWVYLTHQQIAQAAVLSRQVICETLKDLARVGRFQRRPVNLGEGHRGDAYRLYGDRVDWIPTDPSEIGRRTTPDEYERGRENRALRAALMEVTERIPEDMVLSDETINTINDTRVEHSHSSYYQQVDQWVAETEAQSTGALSSDLLDSAPSATIPTRGPSEEQLMSIVTEQARTGLSDADIQARWGEVDASMEKPPAYFTQGFLSASQAFKLVGWLRKRAKAPPQKVIEANGAVVNDSDGAGCTCTVPAATRESPTLDEIRDGVSAHDVWLSVLEELETQVTLPNFERRLKPTLGVGFSDSLIVVQVATKFEIEWLERRLYQNIHKALKKVTGRSLDILFQADPTGDDGNTSACPIHG